MQFFIKILTFQKQKYSSSVKQSDHKNQQTRFLFISFVIQNNYFFKTKNRFIHRKIWKSFFPFLKQVHLVFDSYWNLYSAVFYRSTCVSSLPMHTQHLKTFKYNQHHNTSPEHSTILHSPTNIHFLTPKLIKITHTPTYKTHLTP